MAVPTPLVELGFDFTTTTVGPYLTLDDPVKGQLDDPSYVLGGTVFFDVTEYVRTITTQRGKNHALDQYDTGLANVVFNNNDRTFDPEFPGSPYFGQIIPKREIRISSGGVVQFTGVIDDWNLSYEPSGDSIVSAACSDALVFFANQSIAERTNTAQKSGNRLNTILSLPEIDWPTNDRNIETGQITLGADTIPANTNAFEYIKLITQSEEGSFFISKEGLVSFRDRFTSPDLETIVLADDGSGISYAELTVEYGSELLFNQVVVSSVITETEVTAISQESIDTYGIFNLTRSGLLVNDEQELENLATFLANKYKNPEYRFTSIKIVLDQKSDEEQAELLGLEIGDVLRIKFTPNNIPPAIDKYAEIIAINHSIDSTNHILELGFSTIQNANLILDDPEFGKLDSDYILGPALNAWTLSDLIYGRLSAGMAVS